MKAGVRSTEFWLSALGVLGVLFGPEKTEQVNTLVAALVGVYTAGRSAVKAAGAFKGGH